MCSVPLMVFCVLWMSSCCHSGSPKSERDDVEVFQRIVLPPVLTAKDGPKHDDVDLFLGPLGSSKSGKYSSKWNPSRLARPGYANLASTWYDRSFPGNEVPSWGELFDGK